ncbi:hypothetical protein A3C37_04015 [Candidatus Peribacteria bacterium RIFCSPHIGHO2_02_FULL_53_20]|nr:MAG: hypothetical protein A3C37_04015 [Candidatus Peribacteria bacterium RIFCSPHIGHO2_02_FULL_53_20]OGJ67575.1 MAG: hypothetical protein A3B61_03185 [Candidatus Peribacteria bacterium RIFCSPLOWO2_01_FULL_53_10]OGJ73547.1 MAG: hypothetical protein A3G69_01590 [Candidatus Peribacteria bacterium RIFCSPLOWO2_12_FULL_53_10]
MDLQITPSPKRDFLFIDESGDPGTFSLYYILGLLHVTDLSLKELNLHLGAMRYFGNIRREMKSGRLSKEQKGRLTAILSAVNDQCFIRASAIYIAKKDYKGVYLEDKLGYPQSSNKFKNLMLRRLLEVHFNHGKPQSDEVELVIDRFQLSEPLEQQMRNYLRVDKHKILPAFIHITQADSRYVELLQIADWISGAVKERFFTDQDRDFGNLFSVVHVEKVTM